MKFILILCACLTLAACTSNQKWEYKSITIKGIDESKFKPNQFNYDSIMLVLNRMGNNGWEIVTSFPEIGTTHPNFGNEEYVTGLLPNVKTQNIFLLLKRPQSAEIKKQFQTKK